MNNKEYLAKAFKAAKKFLRGPDLDPDKIKFICYAICTARDAGAITADQCFRARTLVLERLGGFTTLEQWLYQKVPQYPRALYLNAVSAKERVQSTRHAWLDSLIREFS